MVKLTKEQCLFALMTARFGLGAAAWLAPRPSGRAMLLDADANPAVPYVMRLFGVRDGLMGLMLVTTTGRDRDRQLWFGIAIDLIDVSAAVIAGVRRQLSGPGAILCVAASMVGASLGAGALGKGPLVRQIT